MLRSFLPIVTNTFTETLRQPVYGVVIAITVLLLILSPSLSMFTIDDDNLLLKDVVLSTLLVAGLFLAVFGSAAVVTDEIENKTVLTVVSKTVSRSVFVIGKFVGVAAAVVLAQYLLSLVVLMVVRHGVLQTASEDADVVVLTLGSIGALLVFIIGLAGNYFYQWRFSSTAIILGAILGTLILGVLMFIDPHWKYNPAENNIDTKLIGPIILTILATLTLTAIAVAAAMRVNMVATLIICSTFFVLGAVVQQWLGPIAVQGGTLSYFAKGALAVAPSINSFVVTNAIYNESSVPGDYLGQAALYAFLYVSAVILFAIAVFRTREIG